MNEEKAISVYLDRIEEQEDDTALAVFLIEDDDDEFREFVLPADFLPEGADEGEYLTLKISRDKDTTKAALDEALRLVRS